MIYQKSATQSECRSTKVAKSYHFYQKDKAVAKTVLTIDDQADIRRLVRMTLEFDGYKVLEASDGEEGLHLARTHKPDLVLLDVMMPGLDGLAVSTTMRADPALKDIPVVMLTALDRDSDMDAGMEAGAKAYLNKPFGPVELLKLIVHLLGQRAPA